MSVLKRHFKVIIGNEEYGLYTSSTPSSAAKKAVSKLCADNKNKKVEFSLRETTQSSNKKIYGPYLGYMQKLDKPVELEGRVIRFKSIVKRTNQVGGSFKVGDHVSSKNPVMIKNLNGRKNRYVVLKVYSHLGTILIQHIQGGQEICLSVDKVAKIDSSGASAAAAAAAISNQESKIWEDLSRHVSKNDDDDDDWFIIRNPQGEYIKVKRNGNKNSYVIINKNSVSSNNDDWQVLSKDSNHNAPNVKNTSTFVVNISRTFGGNILYECPICKASIVKQTYNQSKEFRHKEGCINIGKTPIYYAD